MAIFYSKSAGGFFDSAISGDSIPSDAVAISGEQHAALMSAQADGQVIQCDADGMPVALDHPPEDLAVLKAKLCGAIDDLVRGIYARYTAFKVAYDPREAAARAFKDAGYEGDPGEWVTGFAVPAGLSAQEATDRIIAQADAAYAALPTIDGQRMRKYAIMSATTHENVQSIYDDVVFNIGQMSKSLP